MMSMTNLQVILMVAVLSSAELQDSQMFTLPEDGSFSDFISTEDRVRHMEADKFIIGNILFLDGGSLKTTDGNTTETIIGRAGERGYVEGIGTDVRMSSTGFHQMSADQVVIADSNNHCLRLMHRVTRQTSPYAGNCTRSGYADGINALFNYPVNIIADNFHQDSTEEQILIITDWSDNAIREMNTKTRVVSTLIRSSEKLYKIWGITQDSVTGDLFVTILLGVVRFIYEIKTLIHIAGSYKYGDSDGSFSDALFSFPMDIVLLANNKMLVADSRNYVLRLLDVTNETTSTICTGNKGKTNGRFDVCELIWPYSLLVVGDTLYCGDDSGIRMVRGQTTVTMEQPVNTEEPSGKEYPPDTIIWISVPVGSVLVIVGIIVVVIWACKRRNRNHTQGDVHLTPMSRTQTELRNAHTDFPDDTDNQADIPLVLAPGFDSRQTDRSSGDVVHYYSTVDDSMGYETPIRSNQSPPALPERRDNSLSEEVTPGSVPHYVPIIM